jgi:hypothetical protein
MTDHRIKNNPLSSFENKQRSFSNISYMVFFTYFTISGFIITGLYQVTLGQRLERAGDTFARLNGK